MKSSKYSIVSRRAKGFLIIFISIVICVGCGNKQTSEQPTKNPTDLRLLELTGDVQMVTTYRTVDVTSRGYKTGKSHRFKDKVYYFNEEGEISSIDDYGQKLKVTRDNVGNIDSIMNQNYDSDAFFTLTYQWDENGYPINESRSAIFGYRTKTFIYDDSFNRFGSIDTIWQEGDYLPEVQMYIIQDADSHGNWIKRLIIKYNDYNGVSFELEERKISYRQDSNTGATINNNGWIYGTWICKTPYGTIKLIIQEDGRLYNSIEEAWHTYTIRDDEIVEQCNGYVSSYKIDRNNQRFDAGEPGMWFQKVE